MEETHHRVLLVDPSEASMRVLASRLRMQGFEVVECSSPAEGARLALSDPPSAVVADLWMPSISGVQLCRLLKAEPSTFSVPVILRGPDGQRNRFWAERAGAAAYVTKGRMGDLVRALNRAIAEAPVHEPFITHLPGDSDVRDRIAAHLDEALFESVLAAEVRALGTCGAFDRLFDLFSQFVCQVTCYRWLAVSTVKPPRFALHCNPETRQVAEPEARSGLSLTEEVPIIPVEDEDAVGDPTGPPPLVSTIELGGTLIGHLALAVREPGHYLDGAFVSVLARELAGPIRMASLVEESQLLARVDPLTGLMNRRSFRQQLELDLARVRRYGSQLCCVLFDIDHFKQINDGFGHATGDVVLSAIGKLLLTQARATDVVGRWGGEEFVVALYSCDIQGACSAAERIRQQIELLDVRDSSQNRIPVTASFGMAQFLAGDTLDGLVDLADRAMYEAKMNGRNRIAIGARTRQEIRLVAADAAASDALVPSRTPPEMVLNSQDARRVPRDC